MQSALLARSERTIEPLAKIRRMGDEAFEVQQLRGAGTLRLSSSEAGKPLIFTPIRESSGGIPVKLAGEPSVGKLDRCIMLQFCFAVLPNSLFAAIWTSLSGKLWNSTNGNIAKLFTTDDLTHYAKCY